MDANDILEAMRRMEWQKAKGHLMAMLETFHSPVRQDGSRDSSGFESLSERIEVFIALVDNEL